MIKEDQMVDVIEYLNLCAIEIKIKHNYLPSDIRRSIIFLLNANVQVN